MLHTAAQERQRWAALMPDPSRPVELITGTNWSNIGPTKANNLINGSITLHVTDSGRARTIIVDGTTIYLATAGGGVWKRTAGGWTPITESIGTLSIGSLAMDPANHNILYLGLGDPFDGTGIGLVKSTDGGTSWSSPVFLGTSTIIPQVMVDPSNSTIILAATNAGLFRSNDSGATFNQVTIATGQTVAPYIWSIASTGVGSFVLSLEANHDATTGTTGGQVWTSVDHGATWTRATGPTNAAGVGRITVASAPSSPTTVYAMAAIPNNFTNTDLADFYKSSNGGATWTALGVTNKRYTNPNAESSKVGTITGGQGWYDQLIIVSPTDANTVYWGGTLLLAKTSDGGGTFSQVSNWLAQYSLPYVHADYHAGTIDASGNLFVGTDGGIFESTDGAMTFTDTLNDNVITHLLYSVGSSPNSTGVVIGGMQDDGTRVREGTTSIFDETIGGDGFGTDVNRSNAQQMLGSLYYCQIEKSSDGGATWAAATSGITEANNSNSAPFITVLIPWEGSTTGNEIFTFSNLKVYKSTNYAGTWKSTTTAPISTGVIRNVGVASSNINIIGVVASGGRVLLSSDGGTTWTTVAANASPDPMALPNSNLSLSWIHFDVSNANTVYVASVAADATKNHLWKSTNFGATWTAIDSNNGMPAGAPVNTIKSDPVPAAGQPGQVLYAGTQMGVYQSSDAGATWSRLAFGMPLVSVTDLYISPDDSLVRAATYGRGFWELNNNPPRNDFSISASPTTVSVVQGASGTTTVSTASTAGTPESIAFSASGLPAGATATFAPTSAIAGGSSTLTLAAGATTPLGTYTVTITGNALSALHTTTVSFVVSARPDFSISASPATVSVVAGASGTTTVSTTATAGTPETVAFSASGLPAGATATFAPTSATAGNSSTLTLAAGATTPLGTYTVTITGTAPSATHTTTVSFVVNAGSDFSINASPTTVSVVAGASGTTTVSTTATAGTPETVAFSASGLPAGATATFAPTSATAGNSSTLTLAADVATPPGTYTVTITGTAPSATHTTTVSFVVAAASDFSISASPTTITLVQGSSDTTTVSTAGTPQTIALSASGLPDAATATFAPTSIHAGDSSTLTVSADATTPEGTYAITVTGAGASTTHAASVTLNVTALPAHHSGGCGCGVDQDAQAGDGAIFLLALGFVVRRRTRRVA